MARYKSLSSLKLFLWYASLILGPCILFSPSWIPSGYTIRFWWLHSWQHSLFTQSVRQHFSSARTNFTILSNIKYLLPWYFSELLFLCFFFKLYSSSLSTVQWKFYFHFCFLYCGFPWNLYEFFHYIFQNNSRKKLVSFMTFKKDIFPDKFFLISWHSPLTYCCLSFAFLWISNYLNHFLWLSERLPY